jgi:hypothetical protein
MLKALVLALAGRSNSPILLINNLIVPDRPKGEVTIAEANQLRQIDLLMLALFRAKERTELD